MLDATVGGPASNSYVTLAEALAYMETNAYAADWVAMTPEKQEQTLMMATRQLDSLCYLGQKATAEQALKWPRTGLVHDGYAVPPDAIPTEIKIATYEQARLAGKADPTAPLDAEVQGIEKIKAGSVEVTFKDGGVMTVPVPSTVTGYIPSAWQCPTAAQLEAAAAAKSRKALFDVV